MDTSFKQQYYLQKISDADSLFQMREACQEFLDATALDVASGRKPRHIVELFQTLLSGVRYPKEELSEMMSAYWGKVPPKRILVLVARSSKENDTVLYTHVAGQLTHFPCCWGFVYLDKLVCVTALDQMEWADCPAVEVLKNYRLRMSVSRPFTDISEIAAHYNQARLTLNIAHVLQKGTQICTSDSFYLFQLLMGLRSDVDIMDFCMDSIQALSKYDQENHSDLCETLMVYLQNSKNTNVTAQKMYLHRNTVHYRIVRCQKILGHSFDDGVITFMALVSLYILEYKRYQDLIN